MKHLLIRVVAAWLVSSASFAYYPADGWYFGSFLVGSFFPTSDIPLSPSQIMVLNNSFVYSPFIGALGGPFPPIPLSLSPQISYRFGGGVGAQFGYRWCGIRLEGEGLLDYTNFRHIDINGYRFGKKIVTVPVTNPLTGATATSIAFPYSMSGHVAVGALLLNALYDIYNHQGNDVTWFPYLGLGIGYAYIQNKWIININHPDGTGNLVYTSVLSVNKNDSTPLLQGILGVGYQMDDFFSVFADYRYLTSKQLSSTDDRLSFHTFNLGFNYWMDAGES
jgi:opacity protein-like surface antigen